MTATGTSGGTDTSDMRAVHQVFRSSLDEAPGLVGAVGPGDTARSEVIGSYYDNVLRFLEVHHEGEDQLVTPRLLARCDEADRATVERVAVQHQAVKGDLAAAMAAVAAWRASAAPATSDDMVRALGELEASLVPHLDEEERDVLPVAAAWMTDEEWGQLPGHGLGNFTGDNVWLILGLIRSSMTDDQRALMSAKMPPPVWAQWQAEGEASYLDTISQVRGASSE